MGYPTLFVRLTGCPLRCRYCDTRYAFQGGRRMSLAEVLRAVRGITDPSGQPRFVTVTGGEPLAQPACRELLALLCEAGYRVSLETGGALDISGVDERVSIVMDIKTPGSGEMAANRPANLAALSHKDQVKFVICDRRDYEWARDRLAVSHIAARCEVLFLPVQGERESGQPPADALARELAEWILADRLPARLQIPLHKYLWGDVRGK
uniref:7-carboxy-7-deazaguanine synthase n=1 Tax=Candidatus Kentrum eta TaxID=2126337 RepID=A0A450V5Z7_9GAMM|nr:MAG: 7-carboxy-7-deazaguanine synthase [Candidatus Kentron sp. H]VFJ93314.1 MAG: 7-carboxy-7-deazaguanine synthase [Candidatus Kentron sp. H]VFK00107.1 MAG: 7-carboxy-7-deazaguanine synthase [Candidatus Kentron sp. H]